MILAIVFAWLDGMFQFACSRSFFCSRQAVVPSRGGENLLLAPLVGVVVEIRIQCKLHCEHSDVYSLTKDGIPSPGSFPTPFCISLTKPGELATSDCFLCCLRHVIDSKFHSHCSNSNCLESSRTVCREDRAANSISRCQNGRG